MVLAFVHLYTMFMIVPIFNSMMRIDRSLLEAADDAGASAWQTLWNVIVPLSRTGILIGSIFVITIVMGDFVTVGVMGGQQIASVGKIIQVQTSYLQFPLAAANAVILLAVVLMIIWALTRLVDMRKELSMAAAHRQARTPGFWPLAVVFAAFVLFLYGPMHHHLRAELPGPGGRADVPAARLVAALVPQALARASAWSTSALPSPLARRSARGDGADGDAVGARPGSPSARSCAAATRCSTSRWRA